ncbi:prolyl oligopeptidase family serine peptidase [Sulfurisphaera tokodaii]|nr:prolyl oligopeptidase family serine peptidase [Sulfurisphaera tokodaii]
MTNLRGDYKNGEEWHKQGMLLNKKNVFKDFSEFL